MPSYDPARPCLPFEQALAPFRQDQGLPFAAVWPADVVDQAFAGEGVAFGATKQSVVTPALTLWAFLSQVVADDKSGRAAVLRVLGLGLASGQPACRTDTGASCRARAQLPAAVLQRRAVQAGRTLAGQAPPDWLWHGRHVTLVDGTTLTLPDTPEDQAASPQLSTQGPGAGFPIVRLVVLRSLATACLLGRAAAPSEGKETGATALRRRLLGDLNPGDILLADRYSCSYWLVALAQARGLDVVFRMPQLRDQDFRRGRRRGPDDQVLTWHRPQRPDWMGAATYATIPKALAVRELRVTATAPGCRAPERVIVTPLTDAAAYPQDEVADLYQDRWHVEPDIRAIKPALQMEHLRCLTPFMVAREIWAHFLGYNLIRKASCQAALLHEVHPRQVSFTATQQSLNAVRSQLTRAPAAKRVRQGALWLREVGKEQVGNRPDRCEPRWVKRRPKQDKPLRKPRAEARAELLRERKRK
jgi:hypothetical protein